MTGILLATVYTPSVTGAWASVAYIQDQLTLGWFVRGLHSFGSSALIVVAGPAPAAGPAVRRLPAPARAELDGGAGAVRRLVALFALSGYLLPWDQKGYWAKLVEATIAGSAPIVGGPTQQLIQGGGAFGNLTLTRAYAFHAMALPALLTGLLVLHIYLFRRHGYTPKWSLSPQDAAARAVAGLAGSGGPQRRRRRAGVGRGRRRRRSRATAHRWNRRPIRRPVTSPAPSGTRCRCSSCACTSKGRWRSSRP